MSDKFALNNMNIQVKKNVINKHQQKYISVGKEVFFKHNEEILFYSNKYVISPEIVFSIIVNEQVNRGDTYTKILENICMTIFPRMCARKDISIGLGQIKLSEAKKVFENNLKVKSLLNPKKNLICVIKILKEIEYTLGEDYTIENIVLLYTTGKLKQTNLSYGLLIYISIAEWSCNSHFFKQLQENENKN